MPNGQADVECCRDHGVEVGGVRSARRAVAETKWQLQQLGATLGRLRMLTARARWHRVRPFRRDISIQLANEMVALRRSITSDPFEEPKRRAKADRVEMVEQEIGALLSALDAKLYDWMR